MKYLLALVVSFYAGSSQAAWLFDSFNGEYKIESRWCAAEDLPCANLMKVTVGYDQDEMKSFMIETFKNGSTNTIWFWEGAMGAEQAFITGDSGKIADWTHEKSSEEGDYLLEGVTLTRAGSLAPVYYDFKLATAKEGIPTGKFARKFRLVK